MNRWLPFVPALTVLPFTLFAAVIQSAATPDPQTQTAATKKPTTVAKSTEPVAAAVAMISVNGVNEIDPTKASGSKNATVTMEVFSDFQCPACKQLFTTTLQRVSSEYVNTGKIFMVHRDYPLPMHAYSRVAASYARAAAHIGKNDVVEVALFQNQEKWEANGDVKGTIAAVLSPAEMKRVQALVDGRTLEPLIEKDKQLGQLDAVNQTPTMYLHTKSGQAIPIVGFVNYDLLKSYLDQLVAGK
ncbi:MAG TPA: thioredoxin domain-containing protein [Candidatus Acidoferrum sp.]|nr:thioredoxin domain-containing protein [Candidatus Acidoferrum sp.]